jgi:flagellar biosynthetic protein FliP
MKLILRTLLPLLLIVPDLALATTPIQGLSITSGVAGSKDYSVSLQLLGIMTALTLLPAIFLGMTAFTRIIIVLGFLRQALGTGQSPSNQVLLSAALFLTLFVMNPVLQESYKIAVEPYLKDQMTFATAVETGFQPFRAFMLKQTREDDIAMFAQIAQAKAMTTSKDVPFTILMASFLTSELKTAFQIGFLLFIPFLVIDLVVASILMAMGMMMLSPTMISIPFKIMLFVLVDGWALIMGSMAASFHMGGHGSNGYVGRTDAASGIRCWCYYRLVSSCHTNSRYDTKFYSKTNRTNYNTWVNWALDAETTSRLYA